MVACGAGDRASTPPADQRSRYLDLLRHKSPVTESHLEACGQLADPLLAGDCALTLAQRVHRDGGAPLADLCPQVPEGTWRAECWFLAAERARRRGDEERAARLCLKSGPFVNDCGQHLWQTAVRELIHRAGPEGFAEALPRAQAIHDRWQPLLSGSTDFEDRFWRRFYQNGFEPRDTLDLRHCADLPGEHPKRCRSAAARLYRRRLEMALLPPGSLDRFCTLATPTPTDTTVAPLQRHLEVKPAGSLDPVVAELYGERCP